MPHASFEVPDLHAAAVDAAAAAASAASSFELQHGTQHAVLQAVGCGALVSQQAHKPLLL
jgi:hypothetical protein